jgi:chromosome partitioning protein
MRVIAIVNQKGGCGKTTAAINLSACLARQERRVLLIDLDPQAHATWGLDVHPDSVEVSSGDVLRGRVSLDNAALLTDFPHLHLVPADIGLSILDQEMRDVSGKESLLLNALGRLQMGYDFIIIDSPPSLGLLSINALRACREAIIPVDPSFFSLHGIGKLMETLELMAEKTGHRVSVFALPTMVDRRSRFVMEVGEELEEHFGERVLSTRIRMNVKLRESSSFGKPVIDYDRNSIGAWDFKALADEVISLGRQGPEEALPLTVMPGEAAAHPGRPVSTPEGMVFVFRDPDAREVKLAGDFNDWVPDAKVTSVREKDGTWKKIVPLPSGHYQYKFWVDGEWRPDPANPRTVQNSRGDVNSLLSVHRPAAEAEA